MFFPLSLAVACSAPDAPPPPPGAGAPATTHAPGDTGTPDTEPPTADTGHAAPPPPSDSGLPPPDPDGDYWEGWPRSDFFPTYCSECHPHQDEHQHDFTVYVDVVEQYGHIYCGISPVYVDECEDHHEPGHLPAGDGPFPTDEERYRMIDWMDAGMPKEADLQ